MQEKRLGVLVGKADQMLPFLVRLATEFQYRSAIQNYSPPHHAGYWMSLKRQCASAAGAFHWYHWINPWVWKHCGLKINRLLCYSSLPKRCGIRKTNNYNKKDPNNTSKPKQHQQNGSSQQNYTRLLHNFGIISEQYGQSVWATIQHLFPLVVSSWKRVTMFCHC